MRHTSRPEQQLESGLGWWKCINRDTYMSTEIKEYHIKGRLGVEEYLNRRKVRLSMSEHPRVGLLKSGQPRS
jgi:hypothetical protein